MQLSERSANPPPSSASPELHPRSPRGPLALVVLCSLLATACDLRVESQEVHVRHDAAVDSLEVLLIYCGVTTETSDAEATDKGLKALRRLLEGRREFYFLNWPLYWDLDRISEECREELGEPHLDHPDSPEGRNRARNDQCDNWALMVMDRFEWIEQGVFVDDGKLCGFQRFRIRQVSEVVEIANRAMHAQLIEAEEGGDLESDVFDSATLGALVASAQRGEPWLSLDADGWSIDLPIARESLQSLWARAFRALLEADATDQGELLESARALSGLVTTLDLRHGRARATLGNAGGDFRMELVSPVVEDDGAFLRIVQDQNVAQPASRSLADVRALLHER